MQKRKNQLRLMLLAALTAATVLVFWWLQPENRLEVPQDIFQIAELNKIDRVELESDSAAVVLGFTEGKWRVNDRYDADGNMIRVLFATLQQARPKRAVARAWQDSIFTTLSTSGVKVSLFEGEQLRKHFFAGGNATRSQAFFADPETKEVYVMTIPGYRVYVSGILELNESGWRDKLVFGFNWQNFKSLEALFPARPSENFRVAMTRDFFGIESMPEADTSRLNNFLDDVSLLTVDEYLTLPGLSDSLDQAEPQLEIRVTDVGNRTYRLRMFRSGPGRDVFGLIQESQVAVFAPRKFQALLKPKSFFNKK